jgi:hypothetical protein
VNKRFFSTGYIYIYSILLGGLDSLILSRESDVGIDFEVFCTRVLFVFTYWLCVKNFAKLAEDKGHSYKIAMFVALIGLPLVAWLFSYALLNLI